MHLRVKIGVNYECTIAFSCMIALDQPGAWMQVEVVEDGEHDLDSTRRDICTCFRPRTGHLAHQLLLFQVQFVSQPNTSMLPISSALLSRCPKQMQHMIP